jgi:hypothetical protein
MYDHHDIRDWAERNNLQLTENAITDLIMTLPDAETAQTPPPTELIQSAIDTIKHAAKHCRWWEDSDKEIAIAAREYEIMALKLEHWMEQNT